MSSKLIHQLLHIKSMLNCAPHKKHGGISDKAWAGMCKNVRAQRSTMSKEETTLAKRMWIL